MYKIVDPMQLIQFAIQLVSVFLNFSNCALALQRNGFAGWMKIIFLLAPRLALIEFPEKERTTRNELSLLFSRYSEYWEQNAFSKQYVLSAWWYDPIGALGIPGYKN